ncbi:MAG: rhodanese-like domain-containing protein [Myxococcales bacterium]|nr:rhodanese-like domain-containing protein [Myxococcales bacterium]
MQARTLVVFSILALAACDGGTKPADQPPTQASDAHAAFPDLSVDEVASLVGAKKCTPVDANSKDTRGKHGVVPGAVLLSDSGKYDASELPADKSTKLVFYCGGKACTAAPKAAEVAVKAGYTDVNVMRAGIKGWVDAGQQTDKPAT